MISPSAIALVTGSALVATAGTVAGADGTTIPALADTLREAGEAPAPQGAGITEDDADNSPDGTPAANTESDRDAAERPADQAGLVSIVRDGKSTAFGSLNDAVAAAQNGDTILVSGSLEITAPISIEDGRAITIRATQTATITRSSSFPTAGGKIAGMVKVTKNSELALVADASAGASLILDGQKQDSQDALITVDGKARATVGAGVSIANATSTNKPWAGTYVKNGTLTLDGGSITGNTAMRNAAAAVESAGTLVINSGSIDHNRSNNSSSALWVRGTLRMSGGAIENNTSGSGADGIVYVHSGATFEFTGGTIGNNPAPTRYDILSDNARVTLGGKAHVAGTGRIGLKGKDALKFSSPLEQHSVSHPVLVTLLNTWDKGRPVATFASEADARAGLSYLFVHAGGQDELTLSLEIDPADSKRLMVAAGESAEVFDLLDNPYADNLGLSLKPELQGAENLELLRKKLQDIFQGIETPEKSHRFEQVSQIEQYATYLEDHRGEIEQSVLTLSQLGDPVQDRNRTKQNFMFDNLDITGLYLEPGRKNEFLLFVDAEDPSRLSLAWRQVGMTENNNFNSLNLQQRSQLKNGINRITIDLTGKQYGYMLYLRNDSTENKARARLEGIDAAKPDTPSVIGTQLKRHAAYIHDTAHPEAFWSFVQAIRQQADAVRSKTAQDMAILQMGDDGRAQFAIRTTALEAAYKNITSEEQAVAYIVASNAAIQERLDFYWAFDGFEKDALSGPNAASRMRVHTAFSKTVTYPSTMYATGRYFHMPESSAAEFLSGAVMYGWGMSHEYGHVLDNWVTVVNEETNNMYSIAGSRHGEILSSQRTGKPFSPQRAYHGNALLAEKRRDADLARMASDHSYQPNWNEGGWERYIWTHLTAWWNGSHFFDEWDYSGYDYTSSPFTEQNAREVAQHGAFGATMRILRGDAEAVRLIEQTTSTIKDGTSRQYNRIAMAYTMGCGYNFAEYLELLGERDLTDAVKAFCAQYPSMPRKVQYYSLTADAAEINGAAPYEGTARPCVRLSQTGDQAHVEAHMHQDEQQAATIAWELYIDGELAGFSRTGSFAFKADKQLDPRRVEVVGYDIRLNPSERTSADKAPIDVLFPTMHAGETDGNFTVTVQGAPKGSTLTYDVEDTSVLTIDNKGKITPRNAGSTAVDVTIQRADGTIEGPFRFTATVLPRELVLQVDNALMFTGEALPQPKISIKEGSLMGSDKLGDAQYAAFDANGAAADLTQVGTYQLHATVEAPSANYHITVLPGTLTVKQDAADPSWVVMKTANGKRLEPGAWANSPITLSASQAQGEAGTYDHILGNETGAEGLVVQTEGKTTHTLRFATSSGKHIGAQSSPIEVDARIDLTAPTVALSTERVDEDGQGVRVTLHAADEAPKGVNEASGIDALHVTVSNEQGVSVLEKTVKSDNLSFELTNVGTYSIEAKTRDQAGNESVPAQHTVTVERTDHSQPDGTPDTGDESHGGNSGSEGNAPTPETGQNGAPSLGNKKDDTPSSDNGKKTPGPAPSPTTGKDKKRPEEDSASIKDRSDKLHGQPDADATDGKVPDAHQKQNVPSSAQPITERNDDRKPFIIGFVSLVIVLIIAAALRFAHVKRS